jgi:hypothetical protein
MLSCHYAEPFDLSQDLRFRDEESSLNLSLRAYGKQASS